MQSKTLKTVQVFMRAGHIMSKIAFIASIVGASLCLACLLSVAIGEKGVLAQFGYVTIYGLSVSDGPFPTGRMYASLASGLIYCLGEVFMAQAAKSYFKSELDTGTPFTLEGASRMHKLGAAIFLISIGCVVLAQVSCAVVGMSYSGVDELDIKGYAQVGLGLTFILVSLLCKLGAEQRITD